jgi:aryl-alcohol dehydrogenase-like predicted oxidoreductase
MVGFNILNQLVIDDVLVDTQKNNIGTMNMYAVRWGLADEKQAGQLIDEAIKLGEIDSDDIDRNDPFGFLVEDGRRIPLTEAAYRFCRHTPGIDVVMTGTGNMAHLEQNLRAIQMPPLPAEHVARLRKIFGRVKTITGNPMGGGD